MNVDRHAPYGLLQKRDRVIEGVRVRAGAVGTVAGGAANEVPGHDHGGRRCERERPGPAGAAIEEDGVGEQVTGDRDALLGRQQGQRQRQRREHGARPPAVAPPAIVRDQAQHREHRRHQHAAVGEPADREAVAVIDRVEDRGQPGHPRRREQAAIEDRDQRRQRRHPQDAVQVHQPLAAAARQPEFDVVNDLGERPEEPPAQARRRPPRQLAARHRLARLRRAIGIGVQEQVTRRTGGVPAFDDARPIHVIVDAEAVVQRRQRQRRRQQRRHRHDARRRKPPPDHPATLAFAAPTGSS